MRCQPVSDISRQVAFADGAAAAEASLRILRSTLQWGHLCPVSRPNLLLLPPRDRLFIIVSVCVSVLCLCGRPPRTPYPATRSRQTNPTHSSWTSDLTCSSQVRL